MLIENLIKNLEILKDEGIDFIPKFTGKKELLLNQLKNKVIKCNKCNLYKKRTNIVFGEGNINTRLMFIGEAPGKFEDLSGKPFVGDAGKLLTKIISAMGLTRNDVYICNILKCRPPDNRNPEKNEIDNCITYLLEQIEIISPEIIVTLGKVSTLALLNKEDSINKLRGKFYNFNGIKLLPTFHPAHLLHHPENKKFVWQDMKLVMKELGIK